MGAIAMTPTAIGSWDVTLGSMRVVFGADAIDGLGERVAELGCTRVLLVSDDGVCQAGIADRARASLEARSIRCELFRDVCENPGTQQVAAGTAVARSSTCGARCRGARARGRSLPAPRMRRSTATSSARRRALGYSRCTSGRGRRSSRAR